MNSETALAHFIQEAVPRERSEMLAAIGQDWDEAKKDWVQEFVADFRQWCKVIREQQIAGKKGAIGFITYSMLRTDIAQGRSSYLVQATDSSWLFDASPVEGHYDSLWAYRYLDLLADRLKLASREYKGAVHSAHLERIRLREAVHIHRVVVSLIRLAMLEASQSSEFQAVEKAEVFEIRVGEYWDHSECVFRLDLRKRDAEEVRSWLQEKNEEDYAYEAFHAMDLSEGDWEGIDLRYSVFRDCCLSNSCFLDGILIGTLWQDCRLEGANFAYSLISGANYSGCSMPLAVFRGVQGKRGLLVFDGFPPIFEAVQFAKANLTGADFTRANLPGAVFTGATLKKAVFRGANLKGARFDKADLTGADFQDADITGVDWKDAHWGEEDHRILSREMEGHP
ncbi:MULTISPECIES: pentapeptide repeat-containing protein [Paenibacillus]|uniref:Pentapeptide repeat-containing protein n=1 Tax=Paenibacillus albilobatus TaxID=2716884 RepID=A0A920CA07_9BACL|nr:MULTISPECIES: pentapeptide repeat-containing protein [Paenibacillus]GIO29007.1 hypothetical protein J2TS6_01480 [Paenibacillus albilobatus]